MLSMIINWVALWHKHHGTWHKQYFMYFLVITIVAFWHKYTLSLVLNGQELNIDDIPVDVSIDVPLVNSEERNEPKLESVVINRFTMDDLENDLDNENDQEWSHNQDDTEIQ